MEVLHFKLREMQSDIDAHEFDSSYISLLEWQFLMTASEVLETIFYNEISPEALGKIKFCTHKTAVAGSS